MNEVPYKHSSEERKVKSVLLMLLGGYGTGKSTLSRTLLGPKVRLATGFGPLVAINSGPPLL